MFSFHFSHQETFSSRASFGNTWEFLRYDRNYEEVRTNEIGYLKRKLLNDRSVVYDL